MKSYKVNELINPNSELFKILRLLPKPTETGPWVAGGSIWKAMKNIPLDGDIDFFFKDDSQVKECISLMKSLPYVNRVISEKSNKYNTTYEFNVNKNDFNKIATIQFISFKQWNNPESLLGDFDFTVCQFLYDGEHIYTGNDSIEHLHEKRIVFNRISKYNHTIHHLAKYTNRGFKVSTDQQKILDDAKLNNETLIRNPKTGVMEKVEDDWNNYETPIQINNDLLFNNYTNNYININNVPLEYVNPTPVRPLYDFLTTDANGITTGITTNNYYANLGNQYAELTATAQLTNETIITARQVIEDDIMNDLIARDARDNSNFGV